MFGRTKKGILVIDRRPPRLGTFSRLEHINAEVQRLIQEVLDGHPKKEVMRG